MDINILLKNLELNPIYKSHGMLLVSVMFIWSGINAIINFEKKVNTLMNKTNINKIMCQIGIILVIILQTLGFVLLIEYYYNYNNIFNILNLFIKISQKQLIQIILILVLLFLIIVTIIFHPPNKKLIPFLSNLSLFGFTLYVYSDLFNLKTI